MTMKREAAYHEAGHAVLAHLSQFHQLVGSIELASYGAGVAFIGLMHSKVAAAGLPVEASVASHPEVAKDLGRILVGGLVSERIAAARDPSLTPDPVCAMPDHKLLVSQLLAAGLSSKFDRLEAEAEALLNAHWSVVDDLADLLLSHGGADCASVNTLVAARCPP